VSERKESSGLTRRDFLKASVATLGGAGVLLLGKYFSALAAEEPTHSLPDPETRTLNNLEILREIKDTYGVEIPVEVSEKYLRETPFGVKQTNTIPTFEEAELLSKTVALVPGAQFLSGLVIPYREITKGVDAPSYMGRQWPFFLQPSKYPKGFPKDRFLSETAAIKLILPPEKEALSDPLPEAEDPRNLIPPLVQISLNPTGIKVKIPEKSIPRTILGERLSQVLVHEFAHGFQDPVSLANSKDLKEYWYRQAFTLLLKNTIDITNPVYVSFAKLNGWKLVSVRKLWEQYDPKTAYELYVKRGIQESLQVWDRDPKYWGPLEDRNARLSVYATYGPIQEAFAEFWTAYILYPDLLTDEERKYFGWIAKGLRNDPGQLIQEMLEKYGGPEQEAIAERQQTAIERIISKRRVAPRAVGFSHKYVVFY
jgi:hypothetical protein